MSPTSVTIPILTAAPGVTAGAVTLTPTPVGIAITLTVPTAAIVGGAVTGEDHHFIGVIPWWELPWFTAAWWRELS